MTEETEARMAALEAKIELLNRVMAQAAELMKDVLNRLDEERGRSEASLVITMALVQALGRVAPEVLNGIIHHIDRVEGDLASDAHDAATARELAAFREALHALRQGSP